ncbi:MAG: 3-ketoacyl-ACP reductase [Deltaproteobacteria bacterium]|nr:3-ketoacyl-ACP reductase [Deltaproteobacteria bacterium]MBW1995067.1 3-ketoacyl-ACP reductase [Deltaproteobacteria bacterium]MBW2152483.1 3-ketoacyl-ACP reductase [Deltaproteobacteria bacterium]
MAFKENNKPVALITGSRKGIGLGIALELASSGFDMVLNGSSAIDSAIDAMGKVKAAGARVRYIQTDISNSKDRDRLIAETQDSFGRLDILVNNAAVAPLVREDILKANEQSFDRLISINLKGPYFLTQLAANWMILQKKEDPNRDPKIINVSSISAYTASPLRGDYCISKAGISMMTALFAARLAEYGIGVFEIRPGIVATDMTAPVKDRYDPLIRKGLTPIRRWGQPADIGKAVAAIALGYFPFSTGEVFNIDGGFHLRIL